MGDKAVEEWSVQDVCVALRGRDWVSEGLLVLFASNNVDGLCLTELTLDDLQHDFFINKKSEAEAILHAIHNLTATEETFTPEDSPVSTPTPITHAPDPEQEEVLSSLEANLQAINSRMRLPTPITQPEPDPTPLSTPSSPALSESSTVEDYSVNPRFHSDDTMTWREYVQIQAARCRSAGERDVMKWLGGEAVEGVMYEQSGPEEVVKARRRRYKIHAKRCEWMRQYGVLGCSAEMRDTAQSFGILEGASRSSTLTDLHLRWANAINTTTIPFLTTISLLRSFFYWRHDAIHDPEQRSFNIPVDRNGGITVQTFREYITTITTLLPKPEFEKLLTLFDEAVVLPKTRLSQDNIRKRLLIELFHSWDFCAVGYLTAEFLHSVLDGYNEHQLDPALVLQSLPFEGHIHGTEFVDIMFTAARNVRDNDYEQVHFKLVCSYERARSVYMECERQRLRCLGEEAPLESRSVLDTLRMTVKEVRAAYLLCSKKAPIIFIGVLSDPSSSLEVFAFEKRAQLRYSNVQCDATANASLKRIGEATAKGFWQYTTVSEGYEGRDAYLRSVAMLLETKTMGMMHKRFRLYLFVPDVALPKLLTRRAVQVQADTRNKYEPTFIIRPGVCEHEKQWR